MAVEGPGDLDLRSTPPFGQPWDAIQLAAHAWVRQPSAMAAWPWSALQG